MKKLLLAITVAISILSCRHQPDTARDKPGMIVPIDSSFIAGSGADDYGMKQYVMAFLKRGPVRNHDSAEAARIQREHLDNIKRMADQGLLVLAGPFLDSGDIRGIYIFNVATLQEARELTETDPAIRSGRLEMELHPWYGSAALLKVTEIHKTIWHKEI